METMNKAFYSRMMKSTRRLKGLEPRKERSTTTLINKDYKTPCNVHNIIKPYRNELAKTTKGKQRSRVIKKAKSINTKTIK